MCHADRGTRNRCCTVDPKRHGTVGVGGEHAAVAPPMEAGRRDEGGEPRDEVERVEQDGVSAVLPGRLEAEAYAAIRVEREALLGERRSREVAAKSFEALAIATVERDLRVHIDPAHLVEGLRL